ncbi:hypothetical protein BGX34_008207 [Mortierella sp. NVP85]|nr:hypothetical protein BGX34_008207 [Mortierella sp. NVP85]
MDQQISSPQSGTSIAPAQSNIVEITKGVKGAKKPKQPLNEKVQEVFTVLSDLAAKGTDTAGAITHLEESWEIKSRFPQPLRDPLFKCARIALETRTKGYLLEDVFLAHLKVILPYNKFTLKKLIYKNILPEWSSGLTAKRDCMLATFKGHVETEGAKVGLNEAWNQKYGHEANKPRPVFVWNQSLRLLLWELMEKFLEIRAVSQELHKIDATTFPEHESEEKTIEEAFTMILSCFPDGWMNLSEISRQYTDLKEKVFKEPISRTSTPSQDEHEPIDVITIDSPTLDSQEILLLPEDELGKSNFVHEPNLTDNNSKTENGQLDKELGMLFSKFLAMSERFNQNR